MQREELVRKERNQLSEGHSRSEDCRGRDLSGHGKKLIEQRALTNWGCQKKRLVRPWKETDRARGTHILEAAEGLVMMPNEIDRAWGTHQLEMVVGGTHQDT
jgi:hypothetical protein